MTVRELILLYDLVHRLLADLILYSYVIKRAEMCKLRYYVGYLPERVLVEQMWEDFQS